MSSFDNGSWKVTAFYLSRCW